MEDERQFEISALFKPFNLIAAALLLIGFMYWRADGATFEGRPTVIDGDTLRMSGMRIRLRGIDAPESGQSCKDERGRSWHCGNAATEALKELIGGSKIECRRTGTDRYGRALAVCLKGETDLNSWMVRNGWAVAYWRYSLRYILEEWAARYDDVGIWAGDFETPENWRRRN